MKKQIIHTEKAGVSGGPYSQAIEYGGLIYLSGQGPIDPETNEIRLGTVESEATIALTNVRLILKAAGSALDHVLRVTVYLLHMNEYDRFNAVYRDFFTGGLPARTCIQAGKLPFDTRVENDVIAAKPG